MNIDKKIRNFEQKFKRMNIDMLCIGFWGKKFCPPSIIESGIAFFYLVICYFTGHSDLKM